jgi:Peptidase family M23
MSRDSHNQQRIQVPSDKEAPLSRVPPHSSDVNPIRQTLSLVSRLPRPEIPEENFSKRVIDPTIVKDLPDGQIPLPYVESVGASSTVVSFHTSRFGTTVVAPVTGVVVAAGWQDGIGNFADIEEKNGSIYRVTGINNLELNVGTKVAAGEPFASVVSLDKDTPSLGYTVTVSIRDGSGKAVPVDKYLRNARNDIVASTLPESRNAIVATSNLIELLPHSTGAPISPQLLDRTLGKVSSVSPSLTMPFAGNYGFVQSVPKEFEGTKIIQSALRFGQPIPSPFNGVIVPSKNLPSNTPAVTLQYFDPASPTQPKTITYLGVNSPAFPGTQIRAGEPLAYMGRTDRLLFLRTDNPAEPHKLSSK